MFWERFNELCVLRNTKPNPVAKELGISSGIVTKWKNGSLPNSDTLLKIADYFDISIDFLLGRDIKFKEEELQKIKEKFGDATGTSKHKSVLPVPVPPYQTSVTPAKALETNNASTIDLYNPKIAKAYNGLTTEEQLKVQMFILDTAAASEKSNAKVEVIEKTE